MSGSGGGREECGREGSAVRAQRRPELPGMMNEAAHQSTHARAGTRNIVADRSFVYGQE